MKAKVSILFTYGGGRACNQMLNAVHLRAVAEEYPEDIEIYAVPSLEYGPLYPELAKKVLCPSRPLLKGLVGLILSVFSNNQRIKRKLMERMLPILLHFTYRLGRPRIRIVTLNESSSLVCGERVSDPNWLHKTIHLGSANAGTVLLGGWGLRNWDLVFKHRSVLAGLIRTESVHADSAFRFLKKIGSSEKRLVGILIRQTDYSIWEDGRYFFPTTDYIQLMRKIAGDEHVRFLVASDQEQELSAFSGLDVEFCSGAAIGPGHYMENFFELSGCAYIVSPPSSFAFMAAFVGAGQIRKVTRVSGVPELGSLMNLEESVSDPDFQKVCG